MKTDYRNVTEVSGNLVSSEQIARMHTRYHFALKNCMGKDVLELGCGSGIGLGYLNKVAKSVVGGDISTPLLLSAQTHYGGRIPLILLDAQILPFKNHTFDTVLLYEAIYYLKDPPSFVKECERILRPRGTMLICNPNKDLADFNPSPYSYRYFSPPDFLPLLRPFGFHVKCFGDCKVVHNGKQRTLSLIKKMMVKYKLMPKTMDRKQLFKRAVFGKLVSLPPELDEADILPEIPCEIGLNGCDTRHKVIFAVAQKI
jgi:SAM-dependent methyltransferase